MAKSNMRSVRRRQTNRRIQMAQYDRRSQLQTRAHKRTVHKRAHATKSVTVKHRVGVYWRRATAFLSSLVGLGGYINWGDSTLIDLDLTESGIFGSRRGAGAAWLRGMFPLNPRFKMRSTRDGRPV